MQKNIGNKTAPVRLRFRPVRWQRDLTAMMYIERAGFARPWDREKFLHFSLRADVQAVIAELDGVVVGYILCELYDDRVHVAHVAVHPAHQSQGIGSALIQSTCDSSVGRPVTLNARVSNMRARELYEHLGFALVQFKPAHYDDGEAAVVMRYAPWQPRLISDLSAPLGTNSLSPGAVLTS